MHTGEVNLKVSAEALKTDALCGNEVATVPDAGQIDTVIRTLLVEVGVCHDVTLQWFVTKQELRTQLWI